MRRLVAALAALLLLAGTTTVVWSGLNLVPIRFLWRYGLTPACGPTGEVIRVQDIEFVVIGPGCFRMGSNAMGRPGSVVGRFGRPIGVEWGEPAEPSDEMPVHWCEFQRGFGIAKSEVTNEQYRRFLAANPEVGEPSWWEDEDYNRPRQPVVGVNWEDAKAYRSWLAKASSRPVRLPSAVEWEAVCRAGGAAEYSFGDDEEHLEEYAWYRENSDGTAHETRTRKANPWGLYDLHGNVWEWCEDEYHDSYRLTRTVAGPGGAVRTEVVATAPADGTAWLGRGAPARVFRGGCWIDSAVRCRSSARDGYPPSLRSDYLGFRPALTLPLDR